MATHICLSLWFFYITTLHIVSTMVQSENYIIHMDISAMPKAFSTQHTWYLSTLSSALDNAKLSLTTNDDNNNLNTASSKLIYTYTNAMNGFSANLSPKELEALKTTPGYVSCMRDSKAKLHTTHSPQFLGLNPEVGAWPASKFGEDVIIGLVDTGVWPESESFKDEGLTKVPSRWKGKCESTIKCNNKLIGARFFYKGFLAENPNITIREKYSTRDTYGHGTHTSSTAAGSVVEAASYFGYANGTARGIAPRARVAMYKVVWEHGGSSSDIIAAIDSAISDGVDVLSLSLASARTVFFLNDDPIAIATFAAMEKGVFVSASAGNDGPYLSSMYNGIPWLTTVAAGTLDRELQGILTLGNGVRITGMSRYHGNLSFSNVPIVFMGSCDSVKELAKVRNKIVVCDDKNALIINQVSNAYDANISAAVFIPNSPDSSFFLDNSFASITINQLNGEIVKAYIKSAEAEAEASMSFDTVLGTRPAPSVDDYSSRGPSKSCPFVLKPDISAPGTSILAAWPPNVPLEKVIIGSHNIFSNFNLLSGTSMACPHVAGVAALLKGAHPDWNAATVRSAIMTTSDIFDNTMGPIRDVGDGYKRASPLALGAGHVNPNRALDPGLVYDVGTQDYVNLLCALGYTQKNISVITRISNNDCSKPSVDLNYPSFIAFFDSNGSRAIQEFRRTVTNVGEGQTTYVASVTHVGGYHVSVIPKKLVFKEKNEKLSYKLRIEGPIRKKKDQKIVAFGYLSWTDVKHVVRSPIVATTLKFQF